MRARRRSKSQAKIDIFKYPERIIFDTSSYENNSRKQVKTKLQGIIKDYKQNTDSPIYLEIGMGNGEFINELAARNKNAICIGVELKEERILEAMDKTQEKKIENTIFLRIAASNLKEVFLEQQIDTIFMNFPDPWPKKKHVKHRMTTQNYIEIYEKLLKKDGEFILKTDNEVMYEYTLENLEESKFKIVSKEKDLKNDKKNIITRFESRYRKQNKAILKVIAKI